MGTRQDQRGVMLTVITGPMFSGKTSELIRRLDCARVASHSCVAYRPKRDDRNEEIQSRLGMGLHQDIPVRQVPAVYPNGLIRPFVDQPSMIGVDEAQFLEDGWPEALRTAANYYDVVVAGLNQDYLGRPFGCMPHFLALADRVVSLRAVCTGCGKLDSATRTWRRTPTGEQVVIGGPDRYEALCSPCWATRWRDWKRRQKEGKHHGERAIQV